MAGNTEYKNHWLSENRERIGLILEKGRKAEIKKKAEQKNMSINAYINELIERDLNHGTNHSDS